MRILQGKRVLFVRMETSPVRSQSKLMDVTLVIPIRLPRAKKIKTVVLPLVKTQKIVNVCHGVPIATQQVVGPMGVVSHGA